METNIFVIDDDAVILITQELEQQLVIFPEKRGIKQLGSVIHYVEQVSAHGTRTCIKREKITYGKFFDFRAQKCI